VGIRRIEVPDQLRQRVIKNLSQLIKQGRVECIFNSNYWEA
jgi:hypothetical protein